MVEVAAFGLAELDERGVLAQKLLTLNNADAERLSKLEIGRLRHLVAEAFCATRIGEADALLIAFNQDADYDSMNFRWFRDRFTCFVYVDRIVVAEGARGRGLARQLYVDLFSRARESGYDRVVCEVNSQPPNLGSDAFHAAMGFLEVGTGCYNGDDKRVRYLIRYLV